MLYCVWLPQFQKVVKFYDDKKYEIKLPTNELKILSLIFERGTMQSDKIPVALNNNEFPGWSTEFHKDFSTRFIYNALEDDNKNIKDFDIK